MPAGFLYGILRIRRRFEFRRCQRQVAVPDVAMHPPFTVDMSPDPDVFALFDCCSAGVGDGIEESEGANS